MGYIGPCLVERLRAALPQARLVGLDTGYFAHCLTNSKVLPETRMDSQFFVDIRDVSKEHLQGIDTVIHLAAISNDPMGNTFEQATEAINARATERLIDAARQAGVSRFVLASSCSMYGSADDAPRTEDSPLAPLTAYARSKVSTEAYLKRFAGPGFLVTSLRFSTACGMSERLRLDRVLYDFVANAVVNKKILILSDGTPWRPLIHIRDMALALEWGAVRPRERGGDFLAVNVGSDAWNFQIKDLAYAVADIIPDLEVSINAAAQPDKRSYQVSFDTYRTLASDHQPRVGIEEAVLELREGLTQMAFDQPNFRDTWFMRLKVLTEHVKAGRLDKDLRWVR
jgi:nucleoside-diphosphate-sugar epimerase